ncbi:MAG TPA: hypothetical protein VEA81_09205 [Burkholderiaceae bacterium]|nr:hypothetical protein [Burkholderiaceae bacterium]
MKSSIRRLLAAAALTVTAIGAQAATWTDTKTWTPGVDIPPSFSFSHDITDDGFNPAGDTVTSVFLQLAFTDPGLDDRVLYLCGFRLCTGDGLEAAAINPEGGIPIIWSNLFYSDEIDAYTVVGQLFVGGPTLPALQGDGELDVEVSSLYGDFRLLSSTMTVTGTSVPLPGALALLGIGFVGAGVASRRRVAA